MVPDERPAAASELGFLRGEVPRLSLLPGPRQRQCFLGTIERAPAGPWLRLRRGARLRLRLARVTTPLALRLRSPRRGGPQGRNLLLRGAAQALDDRAGLRQRLFDEIRIGDDVRHAL